MNSLTRPDALKITPKDGEYIAFIGVIVNIFLATVKFLGGVFGNSYVLIADAIESTTDILGSGIVFFGVRYAQKSADNKYPYGYGKIEPIAGLVVCVLLILAVVEIATSAIARIRSKETGLPETWTLCILLGVVILKSLLFTREYLIGKNLQSSAVIGDVIHQLSDAMTTAIGLIGTLLALFAGPTYSSAADWAALLATGCMCYNIYHIGLPAIRELLDERNDEQMEIAIIKLIKQKNLTIHTNLGLVRKSGFDRIVEIHLLMDGEKTVREGHLVSHTVEQAIKKEYPNVIYVSTYIRPT